MLTDNELMEINASNPRQPLYPFIDSSVGSPSYGLSSHGYDIRISEAGEWWVSKPMTRHLFIDPISLSFGRQVEDAFSKEESKYFDLKPGGFVLVPSLESFDIPDNLSMELKDKSTFARIGLQVFNTISECGWQAPHLVIEIYNNSKNTIRLTAGMPIAQAVFHKLKCRPFRTYADRKGKYQNQGSGEHKVTLAK